MELAKDESGQGIESSHLMNRVSGLLDLESDRLGLPDPPTKKKEPRQLMSEAYIFRST